MGSTTGHVTNSWTTGFARESTQTIRIKKSKEAIL